MGLRQKATACSDKKRREKKNTTLYRMYCIQVWQMLYSQQESPTNSSENSSEVHRHTTHNNEEHLHHVLPQSETQSTSWRTLVSLHWQFSFS